MHEKFEINQTKIKGGCQLGRKMVPNDCKSDLLLDGRPAFGVLSEQQDGFSNLAQGLPFASHNPSMLATIVAGAAKKFPLSSPIQLGMDYRVSSEINLVSYDR